MNTRPPDAVLLSYPWGGTPTRRTPRVRLELAALPVMRDTMAGTVTLRFNEADTAREYRLELTLEAAALLARALGGA